MQESGNTFCVNIHRSLTFQLHTQQRESVKFATIHCHDAPYKMVAATVVHRK